jgi:hypothetical protein
VESEDNGEKSAKLFNYGFLNYFKSGDYHHNNQVQASFQLMADLTNSCDGSFV